jgi:hypothetical protein
MGVGLLAGAWVVGYGTSAGELAVMGAITGVPVGAVQAFLLRDRVARSWVWAVVMPLLWALGWAVTTAAGIGVDRQYAVFGAFGAITFMALSGVLLYRLRAATPRLIGAAQPGGTRILIRIGQAQARRAPQRKTGDRQISY